MSGVDGPVPESPRLRGPSLGAVVWSPVWAHGFAAAVFTALLMRWAVVEPSETLGLLDLLFDELADGLWRSTRGALVGAAAAALAWWAQGLQERTLARRLVAALALLGWLVSWAELARAMAATTEALSTLLPLT